VLDLGHPDRPAEVEHHADARLQPAEGRGVVALRGPRGRGVAVQQQRDLVLVLAPQAPVEATHLVVWLVGELPPGGGGFRGQVGEVQVVPAA
jgi:hypothetical protein